MASHGHLARVSALARQRAFEKIEALLTSEDEQVSAALDSARRDKVAIQQPDFQVNALVAALAAIVTDQRERLDELASEVERLSRVKANAASVATKGD